MQYSYREPNLKYIADFLPETISIGIYPAVPAKKGGLKQGGPVFLRIKANANKIDKLCLAGTVVCNALKNGTLKCEDFTTRLITLPVLILMLDNKLGEGVI